MSRAFTFRVLDGRPGIYGRIARVQVLDSRDKPVAAIVTSAAEVKRLVRAIRRNHFIRWPLTVWATVVEFRRYSGRSQRSSPREVWQEIGVSSDGVLNDEAVTAIVNTQSLFEYPNRRR